MNALRRKIWRRMLWWRFRLFQKHRHERVVLEQVVGQPLLLLPGVMNPVLFRTGTFFARYLQAHPLPAGAQVLDMGTGSGLLALVAAAQGARVVAVDINPEAVRCTQINALLQRVERQVDVRQGDLFAPLAPEERFDLVLFNPPFFCGDPEGLFDYAWRSNTVAARFAGGLAAHLQPGGQVLVLLSSLGEGASFVQALRASELHLSVATRKDTGNEILTIYRLSR